MLEQADGAGQAFFTGSARIEDGVFSCRYAGAMLLHSYLHRVGTEAIFATLTGSAARRFDDLAVLTGVTLGFALGTGTIEASKHLPRTQAGPLAGTTVVPELRTLRARLAALADGSDPLALQRAFAAGMLKTDPRRTRCTSSMTTSCPTPAPGRSARAGTPNAATRSRAGTTPCWSMPAAAPWSSVRRADRTGHDAARGAGPAAGGDRPEPAGAARFWPRRRLPGGLHRVPSRRRALGHLPPRPAGRGHHDADRAAHDPGRQTRHHGADRRDCDAQGVRPGPAADPVRARHPGPAGPH